MNYSCTLVTPPTSEPVCFADVKLHLRVDTGDEDALIDSLYIPAARRMVEEHCNSAIMNQTWRLSLREFPCREIITPKPPLASVTSITYVDTDGDDQVLDESSGSYIVSTDSKPGRISPTYGEDWPDARCQLDSVRIVYEAGYATRDQVPAEIKVLVAMLAAHFYEHRAAACEGQVHEVPLAAASLMGMLRFPCMEVA